MLVDKNIEIQNKINTAIQVLQNAKSYIDDLENRLAENKELNNNIIKDTYVSLINIVQGELYHPHISTSSQPKCDKCDNNRMIKVNDDFYSRYKMCDCSKKVVSYDICKIEVVSTSYVNNDTKVFDCIYMDSIFSVNSKYVYDSFNENQLSMSLDAVFYINKKDCEEFCRRKNNESQR